MESVPDPFGKQIVLKSTEQFCLNCVNDLKKFLIKFDIYSNLIGYTLLWVKQNLRNKLQNILGFPELSRTFGPAKLVQGLDLRSPCPVGPTGPAVSQPLGLKWKLCTNSIHFYSIFGILHGNYSQKDNSRR